MRRSLLRIRHYISELREYGRKQGLFSIIFLVLIFTSSYGLVLLNNIESLPDYLFRFGSLSFTIAALLIAAAGIGERFSDKTLTAVIDLVRIFIFTGANFLLAFGFSHRATLESKLLFYLFGGLALLSFSLGIFVMMALSFQLKELKESD